ncbi:tetratricopeptide repeat-containing sensor histidine kinase [Rhodoflexus sp.]
MSAVAAQTPHAQIDSLKQLLQTPEMSENFAIYNQLSALYRGINPELSYQYAIRAYNLAEKQGDKRGQVAAIIQMGEYSLTQRKPQEAYPIFQYAYVIANNLQDSLYIGIAKGKMGIALYMDLKNEAAEMYLKDAINILLKFKEAESERANLLNTLSYNFNNKGRYTEAIKFAKEALEIRRRIDPSDEMTARSLNTLGEFYLLQGNLRKAMEYFDSSLKINRKNKNMRGTAIMLTNIGNVYFQEGNYQKALNNLTIALGIKRQMQAQPREVAITQLLIGKVHLAKREFDKAGYYINEALQSFKLAGDKLHISKAYSEQAKYLAAAGRFKDAIQAHQQAIDVAEETAQPPLVIDAYEAIAQTYLQMEDAKNFMKYYRLYKAGKDSIDKELKSMDFILTQDELDREKQEQRALEIRNKEEERRKQQEKIEQKFKIMVAIFIPVLILVFTFGYFLKMRQSDQKRLQEQNEIISAQNRILEEKKNELQELIAAKDKLFSVVAHDIRSPLAGLSTMVDLLGQRQISLNEEETQEVLQQISKSLANVYQLLNNLLDWARLQTGNFTCEPSEIPLMPVLRKIIHLFEPQLAAKKLRVVNTVEEDVVVFADKNMLEFILRNLLSNAIKFTFPDKSIFIECEKSDDFICIRFKDNGIGLNEEEAERIFNLPTSKLGTKGERGAGIALSICAEFMEKHQGRIWATPNPEGGSIFYLKFPIAAA